MLHVALDVQDFVLITRGRYIFVKKKTHHHHSKVPYGEPYRHVDIL